jgi:hypothetical protein
MENSNYTHSIRSALPPIVGSAIVGDGRPSQAPETMEALQMREGQMSSQKYIFYCRSKETQQLKRKLEMLTESSDDAAEQEKDLEIRLEYDIPQGKRKEKEDDRKREEARQRKKEADRKKTKTGILIEVSGLTYQ